MKAIDIGGLLEAARASVDVDAFHGVALQELDRSLGFDVATVLHDSGPCATALGFVPQWRTTLCARYRTYEAELSRFTAHSLASGGVGVESEFYGWRELTKTAYYDEIMQPERGRATLYGWLVFGREPISTITLGRRRGTFRDREKHALRAALPALSLCEAALRSKPKKQTSRALASLTRREREIVECLRLGYSNAQIGLALGTSPHTVRNQLARIYSKLEASTRAEVVAFSFEP